MNGVLAFAGNVIVEGDPWQILGGSVTGQLVSLCPGSATPNQFGRPSDLEQSPGGRWLTVTAVISRYQLTELSAVTLSRDVRAR
jgi:hypothetical protein